MKRELTELNPRVFKGLVCFGYKVWRHLLSAHQIWHLLWQQYKLQGLNDVLADKLWAMRGPGVILIAASAASLTSFPSEMFGYKISGKDYFPRAPLRGDSDLASEDTKLFKPLALP